MSVAERETLVVNRVPLDQIDATTIERWRVLEEDAVENDPFLSPDFLLPAARHLDSSTVSPMVYMVERPGGTSRRLVGVGVFRIVGPSRRLPLPHLAAYCSPHSYLTGLLVSREQPEKTLEVLLASLARCGRGRHGIEFRRLPAGGALDDAIHVAASRLGARWHELERWERATLRLDQAGALEEQLSPRRRKGLRRSRRLLEARGAVCWRLRSGADVDADCVDTFLELEHLGWKAAGATSLASAERSADFFREMMRRFADRDRAFATELALDGRVIASTANLVSGRTAFAFKIGWDPQYAALSPGLLNEYEFLKVACTALPGLDFADSCAQPGSFIESLWRGRRTVADTVLALTRPGRAALAMACHLRGLMRSARQGLRRPDGEKPTTLAETEPTSDGVGPT